MSEDRFSFFKIIATNAMKQNILAAELLIHFFLIYSRVLS